MKISPSKVFGDMVKGQLQRKIHPMLVSHAECITTIFIILSYVVFELSLVKHGKMSFLKNRLQMSDLSMTSPKTQYAYRMARKFYMELNFTVLRLFAEP